MWRIVRKLNENLRVQCRTNHGFPRKIEFAKMMDNLGQELSTK